MITLECVEFRGMHWYCGCCQKPTRLNLRIARFWEGLSPYLYSLGGCSLHAVCELSQIKVTLLQQEVLCETLPVAIVKLALVIYSCSLICPSSY